MTTPVIDTHTHIVPPDMLKALRNDGAQELLRYSWPFSRIVTRP